MSCPCRATEYALMENAKRGKRIAELEECLLTAEERLAQVTRERDEARAEAASSLAMARVAGEKHDQKCAEADVLRGVGCNEDGDGSCGVCRKCAYRRGAEAMREACARWMSEREGISQWVYDDALSALPIPENK